MHAFLHKSFSKITAVILVFLITFGFTFSIQAKESKNMDIRYVYVNCNAPVAGDGTKEKPFNTVEEAKDYVRTLDKTKGDIVVEIADGEYSLTETLAFGNRDRGSENCRISYVAAEGAKPIISGGEKIKGWSLHDVENNIYKATVPSGMTFRQLYVDGEKALRARSGKVGEYTTRIEGAERIKSEKVLPELMTEDTTEARAQADDGTIFIKKSDGTFNGEWGQLESVELHIFTAWSVNILRVRSATLEGDIYSVKVQDEEAELVFNRQHPNIDGYTLRNFVYYVENAYELMDEAGEWYLDESTDTVYYKAPEDTDMSKKEVTVPRLETLVEISGTLDEPIENLTFSGLTFEYTAWNMPSERGFVDGQAMQYVTRTVFGNNDVGVGRPASAILVRNAKGVDFIGNTIQNTGATGIDFHYGAVDCKLESNTIRNIGGNGISVGKFVSDDNVDYHVPYNPEDEREICDGIAVVNNEIYNVGTDFECAVGIACGYPKNLLIANNTIYNVPYSGISVGFGWTKESNAMSGNRIIRNDIHHTSTILCDAGGIYTLSEQPDSEIAENYIHDITLTPWADYGTSGIYLDEGTGGYVVTDNLIEKAYGINPHIAGVNYIYNNLISEDKTLNTKRAKTIKANAGVQKNFSIESLPENRIADIETDPSKNMLSHTVLDDNFEFYSEKSLKNAGWHIEKEQKDKVSVENIDGNNVLKIISLQENTKVYSSLRPDDYIVTYDFCFADELQGSDGLYNILREGKNKYTANITPTYTSTVRLELKGQNEVGKAVEINVGEWYTCKTLVRERTIYIKVWAKGKEEPIKWDVIREMDKETCNNGRVGFEFYSTNQGDVYIDNVRANILAENEFALIMQKIIVKLCELVLKIFSVG